jgi:hypothetical protein
MKIKVLSIVVSALFLLGMFAGCAKVPQDVIDGAQAALQAAKTAEADRYLPEQYNAAKSALDAAMAEVETQNGKFFLFRSYKKAGEMLAAATTAAQEAQNGVAARKEEIRQEAEALIPQVPEAIKQAQALMKKAPRGKEGKAALQAIQNDLTLVEASMEQANTAMQNADYLTARDKAKASLDKTNALIDELKQAISRKAGM